MFYSSGGVSVYMCVYVFVCVYMCVLHICTLSATEHLALSRGTSSKLMGACQTTKNMIFSFDKQYFTPVFYPFVAPTKQTT